jgi:ceramide glucosyltransferase
VLKPLKGVDNGLEENLQSFLSLDYPSYEVIFSVADEKDPSVQVVQKLLDKNPAVQARLIVGEVTLGYNPKVNNLIRSYDEAKHDLILISDSNVRVEGDYLKSKVACILTDRKVGIVTAFVRGIEGEGLGGELEQLYLSTFYARWLNAAVGTGLGFVLGKSMLFRKSILEIKGGLRELAKFIAEDYEAGKMIQSVGYKVDLMKKPITQYIGNTTTQSFVLRHQRWGVIQKAHHPIVFFAAPLQLPAFAAVMAYLGFPKDGATAATASLVIWCLMDLWLYQALGGKPSIKTFEVWATKAFLTPIIWLRACLTNTIVWRGKPLKIGHKGVVKAK